MSELRHALRALFKRPAFAVVAVLTLALGIGANTAIFSVVDGVLLRPLPFDQPDRLVALSERNSRGGASRVSTPNFRDWRQRSTSFDAMSQFACDTTTVAGGAEPRFAEACAVSEGFFRVFGVAPAIGRTFAPEELRLNGVPAVVVSHRFWRTELGGTADLSGHELRLVGRTARVVGVMPESFEFPGGIDVWLPVEIDGDDSGRTAHSWSVVGRLKPGITMASEAAEMDACGSSCHVSIRSACVSGTWAWNASIRSSPSSALPATFTSSR